MTFDFRWSVAFNECVTVLMNAVHREFPGGRIDEHWLEGGGGSINGRRALSKVLREAVKRGVVSVDGRQAQDLAHHGSAGHDDKARDLLSASSASERPVELYSRGEICRALRDGGLLAEDEYEALFKAFGWSEQGGENG